MGKLILIFLLFFLGCSSKQSKEESREDWQNSLRESDSLNEAILRKYKFHNTKLDSVQISESIPFKGKVNTIVDGFDVRRVNLWSSIENNRRETGYLQNKEVVNILDEEGEYFLVESVKNKTRGYCLKGFIQVDN